MTQLATKRLLTEATGASVLSLPRSNGTDDTSAINAILATAAGKRVRGMHGETYLTSSPLVLPTGGNVELDMTGCTVSLKSGSNCNLLNNKAVTAVLTGTDGACASASAVLASATLAAAAVAGQTIVVTNGNGTNVPWVGNVVSVAGSNITLSGPAGATIASGASVALYNRDKAITVTGGTWDRGANSGTGPGLHGLRFRHVDRLRVRNLKCAESAGKYMVNPGDCTDVGVENITGTAINSNLVQFNGPIVGFFIRDIDCTTFDDSVALTPSDYVTYNDTAGDITDGSIERLHVNATGANGLRILGGAPTTATRRVHVRGVTGNGTQSGIWIGDDTSTATTTGGLIDDVTIENVAIVVPNSARQFYINGSNIGSLRIRSVKYTNPSTAFEVIAIAGAAVIDTLSISEYTIGEIAAGIPIFACGGTVRSLVLDRISLKTTTNPGNLLNVTGPITDAAVRGVTASAGVAGYVVALNASSGAVTRLTMSDIHLAGMAGLARATVGGGSLPNIEISASALSGSAWLVDLDTTTEIHLNGVTHKSPTAGILNARATAVITVSGAGNAISAGSSGIAVAAGGKVSSRVLDLPPSTAAGGFPTIAAGAGAGTGPTVAVAGSDRAGTITVTPGTSPAAGVQATVTFIGTWPQTPKLALTPTNAAAQAAGSYVSSKSATAFAVSTANAAGASMTFDYVVSA